MIDPTVTLAYSTYLGGTGDDEGYGIAVDLAGSAYVTGSTFNSPDFPTKNPEQAANAGGIGDAFVTKLSPDGSSLLYSTYLGGRDIDTGLGVAVDSAGSAYVTGETSSADFPTTPNAVQAAKPGVRGSFDAFVTKLSPDGSSLVYSTYLGGSANDLGFGIAVDSAGSAYVTGATNSTDFPTQGPLQAHNAGNGEDDAFVAKLNPAGSALVYSTYLGGAIEDVGSGIAVDSAGSAYVTGRTESSDFPTTPNTVQAANAGGFGTYDAFVTKLSPDGSSLVYSTYLGGRDTDYGFGIAVDSAGSAYVTGATDSTDFPSKNPEQAANAGGIFDAFVTKLSPDGKSLVYSTYLGGTSSDQGNGIAVDSAGSAYVTGTTYSTDFPTSNPYQATNRAAANGGSNAFVTKLSSDGSALAYSTYLGGSMGNSDASLIGDSGAGVAVDSTGSAYVTGITSSSDFPTTANAEKPAFAGLENAFVTKLAPFGALNQTLSVQTAGGAVLPRWRRGPWSPIAVGSVARVRAVRMIRAPARRAMRRGRWSS